MTNDVVTALQSFLKRFSEQGLSKVQGENVSLVSTQIRAVCERLSEVQQLPLETPTYVLSGLTKCSVPEFTGPFELMLNQERVTQMATPVSLINTSDATFVRVKEILQLANNSYHSLNTSNAWSVPHGHHSSISGSPVCFNCGGDHMLPDCRKPRDEGKIARNRKAFQDKHGIPPGGGRKKWGDQNKKGKGKPNDKKPPMGSGVSMVGNEWMCFCNRKACGYNKTHTSGFHAAWSKNKKGFRLPSTHEFMVRTGNTNSGGGNASAGNADAAPAAAAASVQSQQGADGAAGLAGMANGLAHLHKDKTKKVLEHYKNNAQDSDLASMCADLQEIWGLN
jgi:hypothetical protein